jgi:hypothetical protein
MAALPGAWAGRGHRLENWRAWQPGRRAGQRRSHRSGVRLTTRAKGNGGAPWAWGRAGSSAGKLKRTTPLKVAGPADPLAIFGEGKGHVIGALSMATTAESGEPFRLGWCGPPSLKVASLQHWGAWSRARSSGRRSLMANRATQETTRQQGTPPPPKLAGSLANSPLSARVRGHRRGNCGAWQPGRADKGRGDVFTDFCGAIPGKAGGLGNQGEWKRRRSQGPGAGRGHRRGNWSGPHRRKWRGELVHSPFSARAKATLSGRSPWPPPPKVAGFPGEVIGSALSNG